MGDTSPSKNGTNKETACPEDSCGDSLDLLSTKTATALLDKLKEFRQSYNRTHGQVCEFFEQAHLIEKLHNRASSGKPHPVQKPSDGSESEGEEEDENCTEQKTSTIKKKLNSWRTVMKEVVADVCPNLRLEDQPDINPGLMKHVLDEIRKLKTTLAFQHNAILEISHQVENHRDKNHDKDKVIKQLLNKSELIRVNVGQRDGEVGESKGVTLSEDSTSGEKTTAQVVDPNSESTLVQFGTMDPSFDVKSLSRASSGSFGNLNQQGVNGMDAGKKGGVPLSTEEQKTQNSFDCRGVPRGQKSFFDKVCSNERHKPCEPSLADVNPSLENHPVHSSIVCFDTTNKEGISLKTKKASSRSSIVVAQNPGQNCCRGDFSQEHEESQQSGIHRRRLPLLRLFGRVTCAYLVSKALRPRPRK